MEFALPIIGKLGKKKWTPVAESLQLKKVVRGVVGSSFLTDVGGNIILLAWKPMERHIATLLQQSRERRKGHESEITGKWYLKVKDGERAKNKLGITFPWRNQNVFLSRKYLWRVPLETRILSFLEIKKKKDCCWEQRGPLQRMVSWSENKYVTRLLEHLQRLSRLRNQQGGCSVSSCEWVPWSTGLYKMGTRVLGSSVQKRDRPTGDIPVKDHKED